ncbi:sugar phosphate isomerase/epimerase family protein [Paenibacillus protaetiae]|uniref:Sugar phosphate isomerase/epimerase n=1 Tax=Paenibacillus protaetiae TaxID=2509456 RepID=A0A4P6F7T3_9BACL|nr:sugar phosphate isomerase/epimerase family protein [Paenibacillus protaetiae]QAY66488.1 sugar phosphate isomerase/epimerase [Paenibacillus protaetiae]
MKLGISTYSLYQALSKGEMTIIDVIRFAAEIGSEHLEIVPLGFPLHDNPELIGAIRQEAQANGLVLSNYAVGANFADLDDEALEQEIARVKREVDIASALGIRLMRHDAASSADVSLGHYIAELPRLTAACRDIADYAMSKGITTSVENHGFFLQRSERVASLVQAVGRSNFRTTLDIGNFLCADEDPVLAVANNISIASMVHFKDFYRRPSRLNPGAGWFRTSGGSWLRGAIVGHGDLDLPEIVRIVKQSGYDGYISIEFEGMEDCRTGTRLGLECARRLWNETNV